MGGHITGVLVNLFATAPFIKTGRLRGLVVTSAERDPLVPEVQTAREAGVPEIEAINSELEAGIAKLTESYDAAALPLETESIKPAKTDVKVKTVALLWLPYDGRGEKAW